MKKQRERGEGIEGRTGQDAGGLGHMIAVFQASGNDEGHFFPLSQCIER